MTSLRTAAIYLGLFGTLATGCRDNGLKNVGTSSGGTTGGADCTVPEYVTQNLTLDNTCAVWRAKTPVYVGGSGNPVLTINAGEKVTFPAGAATATNAASLWIGVSDGGAAPGGLAVLGTQNQPVILTSDRSGPQPGDWGGVVFGAQTLAGMAELSWVTIDSAGGQGGNDLVALVGAENSAPAALTLEGLSADLNMVIPAGQAATPKVDHLTVSNSGRNGIIVAGQFAGFAAGSGPVAVQGWGGNSQAGGASYPLEIEANGVGTLPAISFSNPPAGQPTRILVRTFLYRGSAANFVSASETWPSRAEPFEIHETILVAGSGAPATLTIAAPNTLLFDDTYSMEIDPDGSGLGFLVAKGAPGSPIAFASVDSAPTAGAWNGFYFGAAAGGQAASEISNATIADATADSANHLNGQATGCVEIKNVAGSQAVAGPVLSNISFSNYPDYAIVSEGLSTASTAGYAASAGNTFANSAKATRAYCDSLPGCTTIGTGG